MVAAVVTHAGKLGKKIRSPQVGTAVYTGIGAGDGLVNLVARREIVPAVMPVLLGPVGQGDQLGTSVFLLLSSFSKRLAEPPLEDIPFVVQGFDEALNLALVLAVKFILELHPGRHDEVIKGMHAPGHKGTLVHNSLPGHGQELVAAHLAEAGFLRLGEPPA